MLIDCYEIDQDGEERKVEFNDVKVTHKSCLIIVSHSTRYIYVFKGNDVSIVQKFASARIASQMRLQQGYRIKHEEEWEGLGADFLEILELLGGFQDDDGSAAPAKPSTSEMPKTVTSAPPKSQMISKTPPKATTIPPKVTTAPPKAVEEKKEAPKELTKEEIAELIKDQPSKIAKVIKTMVTLEPPENSECDYVLIHPSLYIILGDDKKDMRNGKFRFEEISTLPEGVFPAENYYPRILISKNKVIGVELWAKR